MEDVIASGGIDQGAEAGLFSEFAHRAEYAFTGSRSALLDRPLITCDTVAIETPHYLAT
jgi:hypothetical protein